MRVLLVGSPGRAPFTGHFRGSVAREGAELRWAGRVRGGGTPEEGWGAAESMRDALAEVSGADRYALIDAAWVALRAVAHDDLTVLFVAKDGEGTVIAGSGLCEVRADGQPVAPPGHPLYDEPGIRERPGYLHPESPAEAYVGVPVGSRWPAGALPAACGVRTP